MEQLNDKDCFAKYLSDGEELLWTGGAGRLSWFHKYDFLWIPVTVLLGGYLIFWSVTSAALLTKRNLMFPLFGLIFLLVGLYLVFGRIWYRRRRLSRKRYAITNRRAIVLDTLREETMEEISLADAKGSVRGHDLILGPDNFPGDLFYSLGLDLFARFGAKETIGFFGLDDPDAVKNILLDAKKRIKTEGLK